MPRLSEDPSYTRLIGNRWGAWGVVQYWRGTDHLLLVEVVGCTERYRRFAFSDLVALTIRPTRRRAWLVAPGLVLMGFFLVLGAVLSRDAGASGSPQELVWANVILAAVCGAHAAWMFLAGPTCEVRLTTTVQTIVLPGLTRRRRLERFRSALLAALPRSEVGTEEPPGGGGSVSGEDASAPMPESPEPPSATA